MTDQVIAGHHADLVVANINGYRPQDGKLFILVGGLIGGGWGAKLTEDGMSATIAINDGDTHNGPSEQVEVKYPLLVEEYALRQDAGGAGRQRGGLGARQTVRALGEVMFNAQVERVNCRPWGLEGGLSGAGNQVELRRADGEHLRFPSGKVLAYRLNPGDRYTMMSGGGGGFGDPLTRELEAVEHDLTQGYISSEAAEKLFGVIIDSETFAIDAEASEARRAEMRGQGKPADDDLLEIIIDDDATIMTDAHDGHEHDHAHDHGSGLPPQDDYELRLQLALARRCC